MTNISKNPLTTTQLENLFDQMSAVFANTSKKHVHDILSDLLGHEEKIMLAKRLAAIVLLARNRSIYFTANSLHLSTATVAKLEDQMICGQFTHITSLFEKKSKGVAEILETIDSILHLGGILPHYGQTHASEAWKKRHKNLSVN